ncbi:hypothetical protein [Clostridium weizhouense]|uniref:Antitoxin YwqK n=1 Tax=Clostridium weizhouense TaxID=2859781 RepID=A0ABS7AT66_9CLOT|nr:hypothetical protein [Clostridium weizhouense]MBW6411872.1 hypothetical protein [Clostridium weizhouense]
MNILSKEEILSKGKEFSTDIGFDPYTGLYVEMDTERPFNGIGYTLFGNGEIESYTYYVNGIEDIYTVEFYFNGKPMTYCDIKNDMGNGEIIKWNENGIMTYWAEFEADVKKRYKEWNNQGELIYEKKEPTIEDLEKIKKIKFEK